MFKSRADLLIAAGGSIKMQEKAGIDPVFKLCGKQELFYLLGPWFNDKLEVYEFPLTVVEGKPVFIGDELYNHNGEKRKAECFIDGCIYFAKGEGASFPTSCSWNPPKPKTLMIELPYDVANYAAIRWNRDNKCLGKETIAIGDACKKTLEETK